MNLQYKKIPAPKIRLIASYLPQFHPIPENDTWWGKGFTEWTNVGKAKPLYKGHYQPKVPADLGYYDLRVPEVREEQAAMAKMYGIEGFCYWHYWFGNGKRLLERPFNEVVATGRPDFPFCLGWANESWDLPWLGSKNKILIEQLYPGKEDHTIHFNTMLPAFSDPRYLKVDGKLLFMVYLPFQLPEPKVFMDLWQDLALKNGLPGFFFIGQTTRFSMGDAVLDLGFDAVNTVRILDVDQKNLAKRLWKLSMPGELRLFPYKKAIKFFIGPEERAENFIPTIIPNFDHSPRSGRKGYILHESTPEAFREHLQQVIDTITHKPPEKRIAFIKSWNEWGEGNYIEPDLRYGRGFLQVIKELVLDSK
jgi:hypothetical protein